MAELSEAATSETTVGAFLAAAVARFGDREAWTFADRRIDFRTADAESDAVARALLASGVGRGDYVAVWMANHAAWVAIYFGILKVGAVLVPLNTRSRPDELVYAMNKVKAGVLFFKRETKGRTDYGDVLHETLPRVPCVRWTVDAGEPPMPGTLGFEAFLERGRNVSQADVETAERAVGTRDEAIVMFTSGTTSAPKGALLSHAGVVHCAYQSSRSLQLTEDDVYFTVQPVYHSGGALGVITRPLASGCRVVTRPYFDPTDALETMESEGATVMSGHQPHFVEYMNHPTLAQRKLKLERAMIIGPPEIYWQVQERMGIRTLVHAYGMTETHLSGTANAPEDPQEVRFNTVGRAVPGVELEIRDPDDGRVLAQEEEGEIFLRVPYPMLGYLDDPEQTAEVLVGDGWYRTGDKGVIRSDGNLRLLGRVRDMIRVGGENLSGAEVEAVLSQHAAVKQAAAVGAPDPRLGEVVVAFVELKPGAAATAEALIEHCRARLAHFKVPRAVHFVTTWPMTGSGKVQKRLLLDGR
jgi:fatty-acyl-CoA synthase